MYRAILIRPWPWCVLCEVHSSEILQFFGIFGVRGGRELILGVAWLWLCVINTKLNILNTHTRATLRRLLPLTITPTIKLFKIISVASSGSLGQVFLFFFVFEFEELSHNLSNIHSFLIVGAIKIFFLLLIHFWQKNVFNKNFELIL